MNLIRHKFHSCASSLSLRLRVRNGYQKWLIGKDAFSAKIILCFLPSPSPAAGSKVTIHRRQGLQRDPVQAIEIRSCFDAWCACSFMRRGAGLAQRAAVDAASWVRPWGRLCRRHTLSELLKIVTTLRNRPPILYLSAAQREDKILILSFSVLNHCLRLSFWQTEGSKSGESEEKRHAWMLRVQSWYPCLVELRLAMRAGRSKHTNKQASKQASKQTNN